MTRCDSRWIGASLLGAVLLAGCGSASGQPGASSTGASSTGASSTSASSTEPSATANPPSNTLPTAPGSGRTAPTSSAGDIILKGSVRSDGLTCVSFVADSGARYALGGPGLPSKLVAVGHSFGRRTSLKDKPSPAQIATVTLTGHVLTGAMSTCHLPVFSVSSAQILSIGPQ